MAKKALNPTLKRASRKAGIVKPNSSSGQWQASKPEDDLIVREEPDINITVRETKASQDRAYQVFEELSSHYDLSIKDIADVLDVTPRTFSRWKLDHPELSNQQSDRMVIVGGLLELGKTVLGDEAHVKAWLRKPALVLDNKVPLELLKTETGRRKVEEGLYQIYHGFF